jgi:hypothetical protein
MKSVIDNLNVGKSAGHDGLPAKAVKVCKAILAPFLCRIINTPFVIGVYPDAFKIARVTPFHKTRLIHKRLLTFLKKHSIIYGFQYGFRNK